MPLRISFHQGLLPSLKDPLAQFPTRIRFYAVDSHLLLSQIDVSHALTPRTVAYGNCWMNGKPTRCLWAISGRVWCDRALLSSDPVPWTPFRYPRNDVILYSKSLFSLVPQALCPVWCHRNVFRCTLHRSFPWKFWLNTSRCLNVKDCLSDQFFMSDENIFVGSCFRIQLKRRLDRGKMACQFKSGGNYGRPVYNRMALLGGWSSLILGDCRLLKAFGRLISCVSAWRGQLA